MSELFDTFNVNIKRWIETIDKILIQSKNTDRLTYMSEFFTQKKTTNGEFSCRHQKEGKEN